MPPRQRFTILQSPNMLTIGVALVRFSPRSLSAGGRRRSAANAGGWLAAVVLPAVCLGLGAAHAGSKIGGQFLLAPIVVTGTRTPTTQADSPVRVQVVTHKELQQIHARTLKEALANVPGLQLTQVRGESGYQVSMQGLSSDQVLVLINGLPITASTGSTVDLSQYALAGVDRIEVVNGATSAQYGSGAMGGVINVITSRIDPGVAVGVEADVGTYGSQNVSGDAADVGQWHARASIEGGTGELRGRLSVDVLRDNGFTTDPDGWARHGDDVEQKQYAARLAWHPTQAGRFWAAANLFREEDDSRYNIYVPPTYVPRQRLEDIERNRYTGGGSWLWNNGTHLEIKGVHETYQSHSLQFSNSVSTDNRDVEMLLQHVTMQLDLPLWYRQSWTLGAAWHRETLSQIHNGISEIRGGKVERISKELFTQVNVLLNPDWTLLLGGRYQYDSDFGSHAVPKVGVRGHLLEGGDWRLTLRTSFGQGYRVPNLKERYFVFDHSSLGYKVIGNPELVPEKSNSWQLGLTLSWHDTLTAYLNLFRNKVRDLIQIDQSQTRVINGIQYFAYTNVGKALTQGIETSLRWQLAGNLDFNMSYTYTSTENLDTGTTLTRRPRHMARVGIDWALPSETVLSVRARAQSRVLVNTDTGERSPTWTVVDLKINQRVGEDLAVFGGIDNLFDRQRDFEDNNDFSPATGRFIYVGFRYRWETGL